MREKIKIQWPKKGSFNVFDTYRNFLMIKNNLGIRWWFNEVTIGEAEQSLDLKNANINLLFTNWDYYVSTKGWM